jgi:hypothetical protein
MASVNSYYVILAMAQHGYAVESLNPVYILLAGCQFDLARHARNALDIRAYEDHNALMTWWLQRIYGSASPTLKTPFPNALLSSRVKTGRVSPQPPPPKEVEAKSHRYNPMSRAGRKLRVDEDTSRQHRNSNQGPPRMVRGNCSRSKENRKKK